jgi:SWI/SNF-related matrix-associated actin-dependent regulator of chromatin subfamily A3
MTARARQEVLEEFSVPLEPNGDEDSGDEAPIRRAGNRKGKGKARASKNPVVLLISLKAGALGLNLTVASRVFLVSYKFFPLSWEPDRDLV